MWHVLTALIYNDLSWVLKDGSLAQRKRGGPRARNTSQSERSEAFVPSVTWNTTPPPPSPTNEEKTTHNLKGANAGTRRLEHTCLANTSSFLYQPDSLSRAGTFYKLFASNQPSDSNLTGHILIKNVINYEYTLLLLLATAKEWN